LPDFHFLTNAKLENWVATQFSLFYECGAGKLGGYPIFLLRKTEGWRVERPHNSPYPKNGRCENGASARFSRFGKWKVGKLGGRLIFHSLVVI